MTNDKVLWDEAAAEVDRTLADTEPTSEADAGSADESVVGSAPARNTLNLDNAADVAAYVASNPDDAESVLNEMTRHIHGRNGTEQSKLAALEQSLRDLQGKVNQQPITQSDEPDAMGLTPTQRNEFADYVLALPQFQNVIQAGATTQTTTAEMQLQSIMKAEAERLGPDFTPQMQNQLARIVRKAGYNGNDPDVVATWNEMQDVVGKVRKTGRDEKVSQENNVREQASRRVAASSPRSTVAPSGNPTEISVTDEKGNLTLDAMMKAAQDISRQLG